MRKRVVDAGVISCRSCQPVLSFGGFVRTGGVPVFSGTASAGAGKLRCLLPPLRQGSTTRLVTPKRRLVAASPSPLGTHGVFRWTSARMYASSSSASAGTDQPQGTRKRSTKGREPEKVITDISPHLRQLDEEKEKNGGVDPKNVASVLKMLWHGREHIDEKGRDGQQLLRHIHSLNSASGVEGYTDLISALAKFDRFDDCFTVFEAMKSAGLQPNGWTYTALIAACVPKRNRTLANQLIDEMTREYPGLKPDAVTYTMLLKCNEGRSIVEVKEAMQLLTKMKKTGVVPNVRLFDALINVISGENFLEGKVGLAHEKKEMEEGKHKRKDRTNPNGQAQAQREAQEMSKGRRLELVLDVLEQIKEFAELTKHVPSERGGGGLKVNIHVFNSVFRAYEMNGENQSDFEEAFVLFDEMLRLQPNIETYMTMLRIACKMRYRDHGDRLIRKMKKAKTRINSLLSEGEREEIDRLKSRIKKLPLSPEAELLTAAMADEEEDIESPVEGTVVNSKTTK